MALPRRDRGSWVRRREPGRRGRGQSRIRSYSRAARKFMGTVTGSRDGVVTIDTDFAGTHSILTWTRSRRCRPVIRWLSNLQTRR